MSAWPRGQKHDVSLAGLVKAEKSLASSDLTGDMSHGHFCRLEIVFLGQGEESSHLTSAWLVTGSGLHDLAGSHDDLVT